MIFMYIMFGFIIIIIITIIIIIIKKYKKTVDNTLKLNQPIFRIFNLDLDDPTWDEHLKNVQKANGKWVLLSPMQMHNNIRNQWWARYQPTSYMYSKKTLKLLSVLCKKAASRNLNIIMDVVWNHTTILKYTDKTKHRYNEKKIVMKPGIIYSEDDETTMWFSDGLPDLNTKLDEVKQEGLAAVMQCRAAGVTGFRIDTFQMIDNEFFDYVFKDTPPDELHLYEIPHGNHYINKMFHRMRNDGCEVIFYNTASHIKISDLANQVLKTDSTENIFQLFPPSEHLMNSSLSHDIIMNFNNNEPLYLFLYFLISKFTQSDKYFIYNILTFENTSVNIHRMLFNWDNYFGSVEPILQIIKHEAPNIIGTLSLYYSDNLSPIIIASLGRNLKMLINLRRANNDITTDEIPAKLLFNSDDLPSYLVSLLRNGKKVSLENGMIYVPDDSYTIVKNENASKEPKLPINFIFFWYQGWDVAPQYAKDSVAIWKKFENCKIICLDRQIISKYLNYNEMKVIEHIEQCIPAPYVYAVVCDYVRWAIFVQIPGAYIDCDVFPTSTSKYLINCYYEYDRIVLGKESGEKLYVNNAFIIVPPSCQSFVVPIVAEMKKNILRLTPNKFMNTYNTSNELHNHNNGDSYNGRSFINYDAPYGGKYKNDYIFEWVIQNTGPGFLKNITSDPKKSNQYMILDYMWMYPNYQLNNKKDRTPQKCGENMGLIQHCYIGDWVPY